MINFILLVALIYRLLYKPVREFLDKRTQEIEGKIQSAEEKEAAADDLRLELEKQVKENRQRSRQFLDEAERRAENIQESLLAEAKKESQALLRRAREEIRLEKEKAWAELKSEVADLSLLLASKVIQENLDQEKHQHLIEETLTRLDGAEKEESL